MRDDSASRSVAFVFVSVGILAVTVAGVLLSDLYSNMSNPGANQYAGDFDPARYPAPAAGEAGKSRSVRNCDDVIFRTTKSGIKYVKQAGGGVLIGAEFRQKFGFYKIDYGHLTPVDSAGVDLRTREKLRYALYNCEGPFSSSGADF